MKLSKDVYERIFENLNDGLYFVNKDRVITYWNKAAERITGFAAAEVMGRTCSDHILTHVDDDGRSLCAGMCPLAGTLVDGSPRESEIYLHHKDGHRIPTLVRVSPLTDKKNQVIGGIELFTDISHLAANELRVKELEKLAFLDKLTQLANRHYIEREIQTRLSETQRLNVPFGILFMDIDHFKILNDTYGHDVGDRVLRSVSRTFVAGSRPFDLFGRWGGEEFIGIIRNINKEVLELYGNRIRKLVESAYIIHDGIKMNVTISVGATMIQGSDTIDSLIKRADILLYQSKTRGRNCLTMDMDSPVKIGQADDDGEGK